MKPKEPENQDPQGRLFHTRLDSFLNKRHELYRLANVIGWETFEEEFGKLVVENRGRPAISTRVMVGLTYLKYFADVSDEEAVEAFLQNPYWQYFCGFKYFQHEPPCDSSSLTRFRKRIGQAGAEKLLQISIQTGIDTGVITKREVSKVVVDTTVQEKAIAFPTLRPEGRAGSIPNRVNRRVIGPAVVEWAERARPGYYDQHQDEALDPTRTVLEEVRSRGVVELLPLLPL